MKMLNPVTFNPSMVITSSVPENDHPVWSNAVNYTAGQKVILTTTHRIYECSVANINKSPDAYLTGLNPEWVDLGATNRFKAFDSKWGTQTTATSSLSFQIKPGVATGALGLLNLRGSQVTITSDYGGYSKTIGLQTDIGVYDWPTYFLADIVAQDDVVVEDLLLYGQQTLTITVTGPGTVAIGNICFGSMVDLGVLEWNAKIGIKDSSKKTEDDFGNIEVTERAYSKRFGGKFRVEASFVDQLASILASVRAKPVIWIGVGSTYSSLIVWGFYKDFEIDLAYYNYSYCSITIEGLV